MIHNSPLCSNIDTVFIDDCAFVMLVLNCLKHLKDNELDYFMQGKMEEHVLHIDYIQQYLPH